MRSLLVWGPEGARDRLAEVAARHDAQDVLLSRAQSPGGGAADVLQAHLHNARVDAFVEDVTEAVDGVHISMLPQGVIALRPPADEAPDEVVDVGLRSPLEIVLASLQSIGSMPSFLAYAGVSGAVVFAAFYTNTIFLLIGAMLISPMAEPVLNAAIATARGAGEQLLRSSGRYLAAIATGAAVAAALTLVYGIEEPTTLMTDVSSPSLAAVLLPLGAGVAGAVNLISSERSSLVSGAGPGLLIAASLAPPMGLVGMSLVLGEPAVLAAAAFLLALQLAGIIVSAALVFRLAGVRPEGMRYARGRPAVQRAAAAVATLALTVLLLVQFLGSPNLRRESLERDAERAARDALAAIDGVAPVLVEARFAREDVEGQRTLIVTGFAHGEAEETAVEDAVGQAVRRSLPEVAPLVDLTVVPRPPG